MRWPENYINQIICGDCLEVMKGMPSNCIDTIITDPPYGLEFMGKDWDAPWKGKASKEFNTSCKGKLGGFKKLPNYTRGNNIKCLNCGKWKFSSNPCKCNNPIFPHTQQLAMVKYQQWTQQWATQALRIAKPGATLLCFGGTRTYHRLACAIEDAGWIIKDCVMWLYGSGFPKATDVSKQLQKQSGKKPKIIGRNPNSREKCDKSNTLYESGTVGKTDYITEPTDKNATLWNGWKSHGLKPAYEPILVAMKPNEGSYVNNALKWGVAGLNIDGGRINYSKNNRPIPQLAQGKTDIKTNNKMYGRNFFNESKTKSVIGGSLKGRYPANVILDEEAGRLLDEQSGNTSVTGKRKNPLKSYHQPNGGEWFGRHNHNGAEYQDKGGASRFFYCAKASKAERNRGCEGLEGKVIDIQQPHNSKNLEERYSMTSKNNHPTVKPLALMEYLCILTKTPTGGIVLDPFCGSGTTLMACKELKRDYIGIDNVAEYCEIARRRIKAIPESLF